ncbi:hypothetical protein BH23GEM7_BH23GEM7_27130 [soil metagenome]|jgi:hypothetical protein
MLSSPLVGAIVALIGRIPGAGLAVVIVSLLTLTGFAAHAQVTSRLTHVEQAQGHTEATVMFLACRRLEDDAGRSGEACRFLLPDHVRTRLDNINSSR